MTPSTMAASNALENFPSHGNAFIATSNQAISQYQNYVYPYQYPSVPPPSPQHMAPTYYYPHQQIPFSYPSHHQ